MEVIVSNPAARWRINEIQEKPKPPPFTIDKTLWGKFSAHPPLPGLATSFVTVFLTTDKNGLSTGFNSTSLAFETKFGTYVCKYLRKNGAGGITLVSNSSDQTHLVHKIEKSHVIKAPEITVLVLLSVNGRVSQRNMLELVQDSFRRSRSGMIIVANDSVTENVFEPLWQEFLDHLGQNRLTTRGLQIVCQKHSALTSGIASIKDLKECSPYGGCRNICEAMDCGHKCPFVCHSKDRDHKFEYRCERNCDRKCRRGHKCRKRCWEDCGDCISIISFSELCTHRQIINKEILCFEEESQKCSVKMSKQFACGHILEYKCSNPPPPEATCTVEITKTFPCGHNSILLCPEAAQILDNWKCDRNCEHKLPCGHFCTRPCHLDDRDHRKAKCMKVCEKICKRNAHRCVFKDHLCCDPCPMIPCLEPFEYKLPCGHLTVIRCSASSPNENTFKCVQSCARIRPTCNHSCKKLCWEECGVCEEEVVSLAKGCPRSHTIARKCHEIVEKCEVEMKVRADPDTACGHHVTVRCFEMETITTGQLVHRCVEKCPYYFTGENGCGHKCPGDCRTCYQGRFHARCEQPCGKILVCGHKCRIPCGVVCPPCSLPCENSCQHKSCEFECGVPCSWGCDEPCSYACQHSKCTKKCSEVCDKVLCFEQCSELLKCGHRCIGYCGEECPRFCKICDLDQVAAGVELFSGSSEVNDMDRFIQLKCGHCLEAEGLEHWLKVSSSSQEVLPLRCPLCLTPIKFIRRFSDLFHKNRKLIDAVRTKIFGNLDEIEEVLKRTGETVERFSGARGGIIFKFDYEDPIINELTGPRFMPSGESAEVLSMTLEKAKFLEWLSNEFMHALETVTQFSGLPAPIYAKFRNKWDEYLLQIFENFRTWPLHPNEMSNIQRERTRLDDSTRLYSKLLGSASKMTKLMLANATGRKMFAIAQSELWKKKYYTEGIRGTFLRTLKAIDHAENCTLNITETERREIIRSFGDRSGRWFKCANGHLYVVTECGDPMQVSKCPECRKPIGGSNHKLLKGNYLGIEMDQADRRFNAPG